MTEKNYQRFIMIAVCVVLMITAGVTLLRGKQATLTLQDGNHVYVVTDAHGKTLGEVLDELGIVLNDGDTISESKKTIIGHNMTVDILRQCKVTVSYDGQEKELVLNGAKVSDALKQCGLELPDAVLTNYDLDEYLTDGMAIVITEKPSAEEETTEEVTEAEEPDTGYTPAWTPSYTPPATTAPPATTKPATTKPATTKPASSQPATTTKPAETTTAKYVVSDERYDDCDGSGHGVRVITYSDGSQDEIPY